MPSTSQALGGLQECRLESPWAPGSQQHGKVGAELWAGGGPCRWQVPFPERELEGFCSLWNPEPGTPPVRASVALSVQRQIQKLRWEMNGEEAVEPPGCHPPEGGFRKSPVTLVS